MRVKAFDIHRGDVGFQVFNDLQIASREDLRLDDIGNQLDGAVYLSPRQTVAVVCPDAEQIGEEVDGGEHAEKLAVLVHDGQADVA